MNIPNPDQNNLFGVIELDADGTVVYSNFEKAGAVEAINDFTGLNFYDEVAPFKNADELRKQIQDFNRGFSKTATLEFVCKFEDGFVFVRILLAKVNDNSFANDKNLTLVQIKTP